jgi:hypothetical protein
MSIGFNPQNSDVKKVGRQELADCVGLSVRKLKPFFKKAEPGTFLANYNKFVAAYPTESKTISSLRPDGVGPGELLAWFIFDNIQLGGRNSSIDLVIGDEGFAEMKGGSYDAANHALVGFKITKDSDPAVDKIRKDFDEFNSTYNKITGSQLSGWQPGNLLTSTLKSWEKINLATEAKRYAGPIRGSIRLTIHANGDVFQDGETTCLGNWQDSGFQQQLRTFMLSDVKIAVNNSTSTLKKIVGRWRQQAYTDYLKGKRFALVNTQSLKMEYLGELSVDMIGLYRIARNQPQARIYLPKEKK